jgi:hypothetical protein
MSNACLNCYNLVAKNRRQIHTHPKLLTAETVTTSKEYLLNFQLSRSMDSFKKVMVSSTDVLRGSLIFTKCTRISFFRASKNLDIVVPSTSLSKNERLNI